MVIKSFVTFAVCIVMLSTVASYAADTTGTSDTLSSMSGSADTMIYLEQVGTVPIKTIVMDSAGPKVDKQVSYEKNKETIKPAIVSVINPNFYSNTNMAQLRLFGGDNQLTPFNRFVYITNNCYFFQSNLNEKCALAIASGSNYTPYITEINYLKYHLDQIMEDNIARLFPYISCINGDWSYSSSEEDETWTSMLKTMRLYSSFKVNANTRLGLMVQPQFGSYHVFYKRIYYARATQYSSLPVDLAEKAEWSNDYEVSQQGFSAVFTASRQITQGLSLYLKVPYEFRRVTANSVYYIDIIHLDTSFYFNQMYVDQHYSNTSSQYTFEPYTAYYYSIKPSFGVSRRSDKRLDWQNIAYLFSAQLMNAEVSYDCDNNFIDLYYQSCKQIYLTNRVLTDIEVPLTTSTTVYLPNDYRTGIECWTYFNFQPRFYFFNLCFVSTSNYSGIVDFESTNPFYDFTSDEDPKIGVRYTGNSWGFFAETSLKSTWSYLSLLVYRTW